MNTVLFIFVILLSLGAGLYAIFITYGLHKRYRSGYLSSYFYFQIFIYVFGVYGLLGQSVVRRILEGQGSPFRTVETISHFFSFLGLPFLIFAWYMFLRLCDEIAGQKVSRPLTLGYFFALASAFFTYGVVVVMLNLSRVKDSQFVLFSSLFSYVFVVIEIIIVIFAILRLIHHTVKMRDENQRKALEIFAGLNVAVFSVSVILYFPARGRSWLLLLYLLAFFSRNIPPLLFWRGYLQKHFVPPVLQKTDSSKMKQFCETYDITAREGEVIQQICEGKSNREISKTLFISLQTVKDHIYRIYQKTDVKNRVQLINRIQDFKKEK